MAVSRNLAATTTSPTCTSSSREARHTSKDSSRAAPTRRRSSRRSAAGNGLTPSQLQPRRQDRRSFNFSPGRRPAVEPSRPITGAAPCRPDGPTSRIEVETTQPEHASRRPRPPRHQDAGRRLGQRQRVRPQHADPAPGQGRAGRNARHLGVRRPDRAGHQAGEGLDVKVECQPRWTTSSGPPSTASSTPRTEPPTTWSARSRTATASPGG